MKKQAPAIILATVLFTAFLFTALPAAFAGEMAKPVITLESFEVPQYDGYWYFSKKVAPTKGTAGDRGAPLPLSFLFSIKNPNDYPILLDSIKFAVSFDGFMLITINTQDYTWIPANKTTQLRVTSLITVRSALLSLLVTGGFRLKDKGWSPWQALERWWTGVPDMTIPV